jgi:adenylate kinase
MRLLIMGPPGAGKGTQANQIARRLEIPAISTGEILRANVQERTALGREAARYLDAGELVPDDLINAMVRSRLSEPDARKGFLLDGYPRTVAQVDTLDKILADQGVALDKVLVLHVDQDELIQRLLGRAKQEGRSDDTEEVIRRRLEVYREQTEPLLEIYGQRSLRVDIDGMGSVDEVTERVIAALES